ncbi:MAG: dihydrodipicolinate synthase family protein [Anaerolineales bacterium]|nr:dihydrodipicolinate synthase family protein [Anaerolineales bacterium]
MSSPIHGVFAAALTPLQADDSIDLDAIPALLSFLAGRGCHGTLLFGTTGEGPSFSPSERLAAFQVAVQWQRTNPTFRLMAGVGTPSLDETIQLTRAAFELGLDGVVCLPPYYFRKVSDEGLFTWFSRVIQRAVPSGGAFFGYHFPGVSGVALSLDLLARLKDRFPGSFAGLKDSSGDPEFAAQLGQRFGSDLLAFTGSDRLFSQALTARAAGCITALANLYSPDSRQVWDAFQSGDQTTQDAAQARLTTARLVLERHQPFPPTLKALLAARFGFPNWPVRPPLLPLPTGQAAEILELLNL